MDTEQTMTDTSNTASEALAPHHEDGITPEHRAWMNFEIRNTLAKKQRGELTYHPLDEVMREFGL